MLTESYPVSSKWPSATRERPCPKCGKTNRCRITPDGLRGICWRSGSGETWCDDPQNGNGQHRRADPAPTRPKPTFISAEKAIEAACPRGGELVYVKTYPGDAMRVARFAMPDGEKEFRPAHPVANGWAIGDPPGLLPLYRGDELPLDGPIIVVEGEKCADLARELGLAAVASAHGSKSPHKSDWQPLAGRDVLILPDADDAGERYAEAVARILIGLSCTVKIVRLPGLPPGGDIEQFDAEIAAEPEATRAEIERLADAAPLVSLADLPPCDSQPEDAPPRIEPMTAAALVEHGPAMAEPIVDGVFRVGEIVNIISGSKSYKTYLLIALLLCIAAGKNWLTFTTRRVRVLLVDNELHAGTLKQRIRAIASALAIDLNELGDFFQVVSLRGRLRDIRQMRGFFAGIKPGHYGVVALDSLYRMMPPDVDENSNSQMTGIYNLLDEYAAMLNAAILMIHHSTKGPQGDKKITDVGSGASAMSRAVDCHLILRAHRNDDCAVLQSALRSFAPMPPTGLRWCYPTWGPALDIDVTDLQRDKAKRIVDKPEEPAEEPWTPPRFTATFLTSDPRTEATILSAADLADLSERRAKRLLNAAIDAGLVHRWTYPSRRTPHRFAIIEQPVTATAGGIQ